MLVKLALAMQRLKKYLKKFCHDQQRCPEGGTIFRFYGGDTAVMRGDIGLMGVPPVPPTRENPVGVQKIKILTQRMDSSSDLEFFIIGGIRDFLQNEDLKKCTRRIRTWDPMITSPTL